MDAFCQPEVEEVVCLKSKRIGWTKIIGHVLGFHVHQDPASVLIVQPTIADAEGYSKEEIQPTVDETPVLRERVGDSKSRSSSNTITKKKYPGGMLHLVGANSPTGFRRITVRIVLFDEVDGYPATAGVEGDQIKLGMGRAETFWNRKYGIGSTPTIKGASRIEKHWDASSKGYPILSCPHCGEDHIRKFRQPKEPIVLRGQVMPVSHMQWDEGKPETAAYVCPGCGGIIDHRHHRHMIFGLRWRGEQWDWTEKAGFQFLPGFNGRIGFHIWAGYSMSPNATPARIAQEFLEANGNPDDLVVFVNTVLGETWEEKGETVNTHALQERVETYAAEVPNGVNFLSAGVDVQSDRIEAEIVGWGKGEESWSIDYLILPGDPANEDVWRDLLDALQENYEHETSEMMRIGAICVDRGYMTKSVDQFVEKFKGDWIWGVNGRAGFGRAVVESKDKRVARMRKRRKQKAPREIVGVDDAKLLLYRRLASIINHGPGYCHFGPHCDGEYFNQLTGEKLVTRYKRGGVLREWIATRPRVEALDCRNYAYAAMLLAEPDLNKPFTIRPKPTKTKKQTNTQNKRKERLIR
jgi:phage terminase large subunit GpA-like protein